MNAPLRLVHAAPPPRQPRATFRVRQRAMIAFDVVRTIEGPGVDVRDGAQRVLGRFDGEAAANRFAAQAVLDHLKAFPTHIAVAVPFPATGRVPGRIYHPHTPSPGQGMEHREVGVANTFIGRLW